MIYLSNKCIVAALEINKAQHHIISPFKNYHKQVDKHGLLFLRWHHYASLRNNTKKTNNGIPEACLALFALCILPFLLLKETFYFELPNQNSSS